MWPWLALAILLAPLLITMELGPWTLVLGVCDPLCLARKGQSVLPGRQCEPPGLPWQRFKPWNTYRTVLLYSKKTAMADINIKLTILKSTIE